MNKILNNIKKELNKNIDPIYKKGSMNFFKEKINPLGTRTPIVRKIARKYYPKNKSKKEIFALAEELLNKKTFEETIIAFSWIYRMKDDFVETDFRIFEHWIKNYVDNWAFCDDFCTHSVGKLISDFPSLVPKVKKWTASKNRWMRRASAVLFIYPVKKERKYLKDIFEIADILLLDKDDLVQKGYGWMLKVAADVFPTEVFDFVMKRKDKMPRTALRYAIEKYPREMRREAMKK